MNDLETRVEKNLELADRYLQFNIEDSYYGIPLAMALEILTIQMVAALPRVAPYIKGIVNLRGKVIPVVDMRHKLNLPARPYDKRTCIIVIDFHSMHVGLIVDMVSEVVSVSAEQLIPPPKDTVNSTFISSVSQLGDKLVLNLDCDKLFQDDVEMVLSNH